MKRYVLLLFFILPFISPAQPLLTLRAAIDTVLKNNFDIRIAKNQVEISKIKNTYGMAGGLPSLNASATGGDNINNINQEYSDGTSISLNHVNEAKINAGLNASLVLFNGFKIIATKEKLNALQQQSELSLNLEIQDAIASVMLKYYDILRQQKYLTIMQSTLDVSQKKYEIIDEKNNVGMADASDILQSQIDLNIAEQNVKSQQVVIDDAKTDLLLLMGAKSFSSITIDDSIVVDTTIQLDTVLSFLKNNPEYLSTEQQLKINEQIIKEVSAQQYPSIKLNASYDLLYGENSKGSLLLNQTFGPYIGLSLLVPIFDGNINKKEKKVAVLNMNNAKLEQESLLNSLTAEAIKTYKSYSMALEQLNVQRTNYELAEKLVSVVMQNFQVNEATIIDVKTAQASFESVGYLLVNMQYAAKSAEIELKQLMYKLSY